MNKIQRWNPDHIESEDELAARLRDAPSVPSPQELSSVGNWKWLHAYMAWVEFPPIDYDDHGPKSYVYFIQAEKSLAIKIGISTDVKSRLSSLCTGNHEKLRLIAWTEGGSVKEQALHELFAEYRIHFEWFNPGPRLVEFIERVLRGEEY